MTRFSSRTGWTTENNPLSSLAGKFHAKGVPVLDLTVSNPTQCGFNYLNAGLLEAFKRPENLLYHPDANGLTEAREAIIQYYKRKGIPLSPGQIFITANTSEAYTFVFRLLFEPGDALLAPQPSYPLLDFLAGLNDISVNRYSLLPEENWKIDLRRTGSLKSKAVLLVNYNNPTGSGLSAEELSDLNTTCKKYGMAVLSDEVFLDYPLTDSQKNLSAASSNDVLTFTFSGISKILGLPQMKLSWIVVTGPEAERAEALKRLEIISDTYLSASTPVQNALPAWFRSVDVIQKEILERVRKNYRLLEKTAAKHPRLKLFPVQGGWHAPVLLPDSESDEDWACRFLKEEKVLTHPGYLFDFEQNSFLVLSLLVREEDFREGLERIAKHL